jgi:predicted cobalt transporter CbtA
MPAFGIRALLFAVATALFLIALISDLEDSFDTWIPLGLAVFAAAFLVESLGLDRRLGGSDITRP